MHKFKVHGYIIRVKALSCDLTLNCNTSGLESNQKPQDHQFDTLSLNHRRTDDNHAMDKLDRYSRTCVG